MSQAGCPTPEAVTPEPETCCEFHPPKACPSTPCPSCGGKGNTVTRLTLGALLKPARRIAISHQDEFCFCKTPTCDAVYFVSGKVLFRKDDLAVKVGLKEPHDPTAPVCYCFGWTPQKIQAELETVGKSTVIDQIKAQVKAGNCYCEVTNPQGSCCLGNVAKAVQEATVVVNQKGGVGR